MKAPDFAGNRTVVLASLLSAINVVVGAATMFVAYRVLLRNVGAESFGLWAVLISSSSAARIADLGVGASAVKFVAKHSARMDPDAVRSTIETAAISLGVFVAGVIVCIYPLLKLLLGTLIADPGLLDLAEELLPFVLLTAWVGVVGNIFLSSLDGIGRVDLRNYVAVAGSLLLMMGAIVMVPRYGLYGIAIAQIGQASFLLITSRVLLGLQGLRVPLIPKNWSKQRFLEMVGYGYRFQLTALLMLLVEPITKLLVTRFGGLTDAAFFEMASQFVQKCRQVIVAANQALVPRLANLAETSPSRVYDFYTFNVRTVVIISVPYFLLLGLLLQPIGAMWIGRHEPAFVFFGWIMVGAWGLNTISSPAYFTILAIGELELNLIGQFLVAFLCVTLSLALGPDFGARGVSLAYGVALSVGSVTTAFMFHRRHKVSMSVFCDRRILELIPVSCLAAVICFLVQMTIVSNLTDASMDAIANVIAIVPLYCAIVGTWAWFRLRRI